MNSKPNKKVFTLTESFSLGLKRIKNEKASSLAAVSTVALSTALTEVAMINAMVIRAIDEANKISIENIPSPSLIMVLVFMTGIILGTAYLRTRDREEETLIMSNLGASKGQILGIAFAEFFIMGLVGGTLGSIGGTLISLTIYGSQFGWPTWLLWPAADYICSIATATLSATLVSVSMYLISTYISLTRK